MQQLHRRKVAELENLMANPEPLQRQLEAAERESALDPDSSLKTKVDDLRTCLGHVKSKEILTRYLLEFIAFANEDAEIQCEFAMKRKNAQTDKDKLFELSREMNDRLQDLTRRYKQRFWPSLAIAKDEGPYNPLQTGDVEDLYDSDGVPYAETRRCTYRRINHFREYLRQQQGKSRVVISENTLDVLRAELKKHYYKPEDCTPQIVRSLLKNLNQVTTRANPKSKIKSSSSTASGQQQQQASWALIYEHTPTITILLNPSYRLIDIPPERERLLCHLFEKTEIPFEKYKLTVKKGRKNFLSYPYMTYKLCELLGWDDYLPAFSLLKSDDLLILQDCYFKLICKELSWQFVPTVGRVDIRETLLAKPLVN